MKVTFKNNVDCDYYDHRLDETYPKYYKRWDTILAEAVENDGPYVHIALPDGDTVMRVPRNSVELS